MSGIKKNHVSMLYWLKQKRDLNKILCKYLNRNSTKKETSKIRISIKYSSISNMNNNTIVQKKGTWKTNSDDEGEKLSFCWPPDVNKTSAKASPLNRTSVVFWISFRFPVESFLSFRVVYDRQKLCLTRKQYRRIKISCRFPSNYA